MISPGPGGASSTSSIASGVETPKGALAPMALRMAALIFIYSLQSPAFRLGIAEVIDPSATNITTLKRRSHFLQALGELHVFGIVHRAVDDGDDFVIERPLKGRNEIFRALDAVTLGTEALGVLDEVGILERDVAGATEVAQLMPRDQPIFRVVPYQDHEWCADPDRGFDLL